MGARSIDMVGQRVGMLTVESEAERYVNPSGGSSAQWLCRCDCGAEVVKRGSALRSGRAKSCGCARSASAQGQGLVDLSGKRFGRWLVVDRAESGKHRQTMWNCVCDCGTERAVNAKSLQNGDSSSCGCLKLERLRVERDLIGSAFGRWTVKGPGVSVEGERTWSCLCECGARRDVVEQSLVQGRSTSCGCLRKERAAEAWNAKAADLTDQRFGLWTALRRFDVSRYAGGGQMIRWWCRCDCGIERAVLVGALRDGTSQSCGCTTGSRMEGHVRRFLLEHGVPFVPQRSFSALRGSGGRRLAFDFEAITPEGPVLIECQGEQHFRPVEWFGGEEKFADQQRNDQAKREHAASIGTRLLEIHYSASTYEAVAEILEQELAGHWSRAGAAVPWGGAGA